MVNVLGVIGQCYKRGYEGKTFPKWAKKSKDSPTWKAYQKGKKDKKNGICNELKELTSAQKNKADKIVSLLLELQKENVYPIVIDGGGGSGLEFYSCKKSDRAAFEDLYFSYDPDGKKRKIANSFLYTPDKTWDVKIPTIVP